MESGSCATRFCSVVIPVYNSEPLVGQTIDQTVAFLEGKGWDYEILLVNDGSSDGSWGVVREKARQNPRLVAINLLRNYGQHTAVYCGLERSTGEYVITMDDDLQNPPEEIEALVNKAQEGHDLVFGRFRSKKHAFYRRAGSRLVSALNTRIFQKPPDLVLTNFRILHRDVVRRIVDYKTIYPYIPGLALMFASNPANVWVEHRERSVGKSNYNLFKILALLARVMFNYSPYPLQLVSTAGLLIAGGSFLFAGWSAARAFFVHSAVPGWTSLVVLISFFNGVLILILAILGEYTVRLLNATSHSGSYHIRELVDRRG